MPPTVHECAEDFASNFTLYPTPNQLDWIEIGRIWWQPQNINFILLEELAHLAGLSLTVAGCVVVAKRQFCCFPTLLMFFQERKQFFFQYFDVTIRIYRD
eukprot:PhF_6_TR43376/c1_g2_i1/m.66525